MRNAIGETERRRRIQCDFNEKNNIMPQSIRKEITTIFDMAYEESNDTAISAGEEAPEYMPAEELEETIAGLEKEMKRAASDLEFEQAAELRDRIKMLKTKMMFES